MRKIRVMCVLFAIAFVCRVATVRAETLEGLQKAADENWKKMTSMSYNIEMNMDMSGEGFSMKSTGSGKCEMSHSGEKWMMFTEMKNSAVQKVAGTETKTDSVTSMVCDGDFIYTVSDMAGQKSATKSKADSFMKMAGGTGFFTGLKDVYDLSVLPDEQVDGKATYVVEAKPKAAAAAAGGASRYNFDKDSMIVVQTKTMGPDGKVMSLMKVTNLKLGGAVDASHFAFKAPAGVEVMDMTKQ